MSSCDYTSGEAVSNFMGEPASNAASSIDLSGSCNALKVVNICVVRSEH